MRTKDISFWAIWSHNSSYQTQTLISGALCTGCPRSNSITNRWTCLSSFDVWKMMFEFVCCSTKRCSMFVHLLYRNLFLSTFRLIPKSTSVFLLVAKITNYWPIQHARQLIPLHLNNTSMTILILDVGYIKDCFLIGKDLDGIESVPALGPRFQHHPPNLRTVGLSLVDTSMEVLHQAMVTHLMQKSVSLIVQICVFQIPTFKLETVAITYFIIYPTLRIVLLLIVLNNHHSIHWKITFYNFFSFTRLK